VYLHVHFLFVNLNVEKYTLHISLIHIELYIKIYH
jgi:hypothetical protein